MFLIGIIILSVLASLYKVKETYIQRSYDFLTLVNIRETVEDITRDYDNEIIVKAKCRDLFNLAWWSSYSPSLRCIEDELREMSKLDKHPLGSEEIACLEQMAVDLKAYIDELNECLNTKYKYQDIWGVIHFDKDSMQLRKIFSKGKIDGK